MRDHDALHLGSLCQFSDLAGRHMVGVHMPFEPRWRCIGCSRTRAPAHARKHCIDVDHLAHEKVGAARERNDGLLGPVSPV
jgi:hypothetical protein